MNEDLSSEAGSGIEVKVEFESDSIRTQQRHAKALREAALVEKALETHNLANDTMSRLMVIEMYFRHLDDDRKKVDASELVAVSLGWGKVYKERCIRAWAKQWI
nr:6871_t:CDS:2 [Entrophospora candida]